MYMAQVFRAISSVRVDCSTTSKRVAFPADGTNIRIFNNTTSMAWVVFGDSSVTAVIPAADTAGPGFPIAPGSVENFTESVDGGPTHVAIILQTGTGIVNVTVGEGW
jgi:hypothetical protein